MTPTLLRTHPPRFVALALALALAVAATVPQVHAQARVQIIHNAPDPNASVVDVYLNDALLLDDFAFRDATGYTDVDVSGGQPKIDVAPENSTSSADAIYTLDLSQSGTPDLQDGESYVLIASGVLDPSSFADNPDGVDTAFQLLLKTDARESVTDGSGEVQFIVNHGVPDAPTVDVIARGTARLVDDAAYTDITDYIGVAPGTYTLDVALGSNNGLIPASFDVDMSGRGGETAVVLASGFAEPSDNQDGADVAVLVVLSDGTIADVIESDADPPTLLSEIRTDESGGDENEYFEVRGAPGASLDGLTYLVIGDGCGGGSENSGCIEHVTDLSGGTIPSNSYFLVAESSFDTSLGTPDLTDELNFENEDKTTHLLVYNFSGSLDEDLDTDNDGTLDTTPWQIVADAVDFYEEEGQSNNLSYAASLQFVEVGPDESRGGTTPAHIYRRELDDIWAIGNLGFSDDTPGGANPLPIELAEFRASVDGGDVLLMWQTLSETSNRGFEIQQRRISEASEASAQSSAWTQVGFEPGAGTTTEARRYRYRVTGLQPGTYAFRLRQVDLDGTASFSRVVEVNLGLEGRFRLTTVYPNPMQQTARASLSVQRTQAVTVALFDVLGRQVRMLYQGTLEAGASHELQINGDGLPSGLYLMRVQGEDFSTTRRLTVLR